MMDLSKLPQRKIQVGVENARIFEFEAHAAQVAHDGSLSILRYVRASLFTIQTFAAGYWKTVVLALPTDAEMELIEKISAEERAEHDAEKSALANMKVPNRFQN